VLQRGTVTAELAIALPAVVILLGVVLAVGSVVSAQLRCTDAARAAARAAARGEQGEQVVAIAERAAPDGARVGVQVSGATAVVWVSVPVRMPLPGRPSLTVGARAVADVEQPQGSRIGGGVRDCTCLPATITKGARATPIPATGDWPEPAAPGAAPRPGPSPRPDPSARDRGGDRGSGTVLALGVALTGAGVALAGTTLGSAVLARHRAEAAADLAALAAAVRVQDAVPGVCTAAARTAAANGARLLSCRPGGDGTVSVSVAVRAPALGGVLGPAVVRARAGPAQPVTRRAVLPLIPSPGSG